MALWQYTFFIVPNTDLLNLSVGANLNNNLEYFDFKEFWIYKPFKPDYFDSFEKLLPKNKSWSKNIILFGKEDTNCIEVLIEHGIVINLTIRIDYTTEYKCLLAELIEFCILKGFVILDEELNIVSLRLLDLVALIENSEQARTLNILSKPPE